MTIGNSDVSKRQTPTIRLTKLLLLLMLCLSFVLAPSKALADDDIDARTGGVKHIAIPRENVTEQVGARITKIAINTAAQAASGNADELFERFMRHLVAAFERQETFIDVSEFAFAEDEFDRRYLQVIFANPQLFWVATGWSYDYSYVVMNGVGMRVVTTVSPVYSYPKANVPAMKKEWEKSLQEAKQWASGVQSAQEKLKIAHDFLAIISEYDGESSRQGVLGPSGWDAYNSYGALVKRNCVCQGYALAYKALVDALEIDGVDVSYINSRSANHVWNAVHLDNNWYQVDVTWDDSGGIPHKTYFMRSGGIFTGSDVDYALYDRMDCTSTQYDKMSWKTYVGPNMVADGRSIADPNMVVDYSDVWGYGSDIYPSMSSDPKITLKAGDPSMGNGGYDILLRRGIDYIVTYGKFSKSDDDPGHLSADITLTGAGIFTGTVTRSQSTIGKRRLVVMRFQLDDGPAKSAQYSTQPYATFNLDVRKENEYEITLKNTMDYSAFIPVGSTWTLSNIKTKPGYSFVGLEGATYDASSKSYTRTIEDGSGSLEMLLKFETARAKHTVQLVPGIGIDHFTDVDGNVITSISLMETKSATIIAVPAKNYEVDPTTWDFLQDSKGAWFDDAIDDSFVPRLDACELIMGNGNTKLTVKGIPKMTSFSIDAEVDKDATQLLTGATKACTFDLSVTLDGKPISGGGEGLTKVSEELPAGATWSISNLRIADGCEFAGATILYGPIINGVISDSEPQELGGSIIGGVIDDADMATEVKLKVVAATYTLGIFGDPNAIKRVAATGTSAYIEQGDNQVVLLRKLRVAAGKTAQLTVVLDNGYKLTGYSFDESGSKGSLFKERSGEPGIFDFTMGVGNVNITLNSEVKVGDLSLTDAKVALSKPNQTITYTGLEQTPAVVVTKGSSTLKEGVDYDLVYRNNIDAGTAIVTARGMGRYKGSVATGSFVIQPAPLASASISTATHTYTGKSITPAVTVKGVKSGKGSQELLVGRDYQIAKWENNINVSYSASGSVVTGASVSVVGIGNYTGTKTVSFKISPLNLKDRAIVKLSERYEYTGETIQPIPEIEVDKKKLVCDKDFVIQRWASSSTPKNKCSVSVSGIGNYTGNLTAYFDVVPASIEGADIALQERNLYTGTYIEPKIEQVTLRDGRVLKAGEYKIVGYSNNLKIGTGKVTIEGLGNYGGIATKEFEIVSSGLQDAVISVGKATYNGGQPVKPSVKVTINKQELKAGVHYVLQYVNNVLVGNDAVVIVTGIGEYAHQEKQQIFSIQPASLTAQDVTLDSESYAYRGTAIHPVVTVKKSFGTHSPTLVSGVDYDLSYANCTAVGTGSVIVKGKGNYTGSVTKRFEIMQRASIEDATISLNNSSAYSCVYTGTEIKPTVKVLLNKKTLNANSDYTVTYKNNVSVAYTASGSPKAAATVTITGKGVYTGTKTVSFTIKPLTLSSSSCTLSLPASSYEYTGAAITPKPTLTNKTSKITLREGSDYVVSKYENNIRKGTAKVTLKGMGSCTGSMSSSFSITEANLKNASVSVGSNVVYPGVGKSASFSADQLKVSMGGRTLVANTDYTIKCTADSKGTRSATITLSGKGNYTGSTTSKVTFATANLEKASFLVGGKSLSNGYSCIYDGKAQEPKVTSVKLNNSTLNEGKDYTVSYTGNITCGKAKVLIKGKGNYTGVATGTFTIKPFDFKTGSATIKLPNNGKYEYDTVALTPKPSIVVKGLQLVENRDYSLSYSDNNKASSQAKVTIKGIGNYTGSVTKSFTITQADLSKAVVTVKGTIPFPGKSKTFELSTSQLVVKLAGKTLTYSSSKTKTDYTVSCKTDSKGIGTITVTGANNYKGSVKSTVKFVAASITNATLKINNKSAKNGHTCVYSGSAQKPSISVTMDSVKLVEKTDYSVLYENNIKAGTAKVTVKGTGNYTGTLTGTFIITPKKLPSAVTLSTTTYRYTGKACTPTVTIKDGSKLLSEVTDYSVTYTNNTKLGTATVLVKGKGNYSGEKKLTFKIVK